jgi:phosphonate transport system ATP-binding protein
MLTVSNLTKRFGAITAVDNVGFRIERPTMVGIIGRSGAGKSTLLRMLNRLTDASDGEVRFDQTDVLTLKRAALRQWRSDCAMIFQQFNLVPRMDVVSNVLHGTLAKRSAVATLFNFYPKDDIERAIETLERFGMADHAQKRVESLSGGQQQRVAIARALMQAPKLVLADEPISSLDPMNAQIVIQSLRKIHDEDGRTVLVNLHSPEIARQYCDRVIGMRDGRIMFDGAPDALTKTETEKIYS